MTRIKSLGLGSNRNFNGFLHRTHRSKKNRKSSTYSYDTLRIGKTVQAELDRKRARQTLRREKLWIRDYQR